MMVNKSVIADETIRSNSLNMMMYQKGVLLLKIDLLQFKRLGYKTQVRFLFAINKVIHYELWMSPNPCPHPRNKRYLQLYQFSLRTRKRTTARNEIRRRRNVCYSIRCSPRQPIRP